MADKSIVMKEKDNIATALQEIKKNSRIKVKIGDRAQEITINQDIPFGHKFAITDIKKGEEIIKYGESIGEASQEISCGDYVHVHNLDSKRGRGDLTSGGEKNEN